jgi:hypothetical protein
MHIEKGRESNNIEIGKFRRRRRHPWPANRRRKVVLGKAKPEALEGREYARKKIRRRGNRFPVLCSRVVVVALISFNSILPITHGLSITLPISEAGPCVGAHSSYACVILSAVYTPIPCIAFDDSRCLHPHTCNFNAKKFQKMHVCFSCYYCEFLMTISSFCMINLDQNMWKCVVFLLMHLC